MTHRRPHLSERPHTVYRAYSSGDHLLYVGCTAKSLSRIDQQKSSEWWPTVLYMTFEHFPNQAEARAAEAHAIDHEDPLYNVRRTGWDPYRADEIRASVRERIDASTEAAS